MSSCDDLTATLRNSIEAYLFTYSRIPTRVVRLLMEVSLVWNVKKIWVILTGAPELVLRTLHLEFDGDGRCSPRRSSACLENGNVNFAQHSHGSRQHKLIHNTYVGIWRIILKYNTHTHTYIEIEWIKSRLGFAWSKSSRYSDIAVNVSIITI